MLRIGTQKQLFLWKQERFFSFDFLKAFCMACIFHLTLFLGLRYHTPPNLDLYLPITPALVEIDLNTLEPSYPTPTYISPIESIQPPALLEMPEPQFVLELPFFHKAQIEEPDFSQVEKINYEFLEDLDD